MTAARRTHYDVLGVSPSASPSEIKRAYLLLAKKHHPDVAGRNEDPAVFALISHAYDVLKDPSSRRSYDGSISGPSTSSTAPFRGPRAPPRGDWREQHARNANWRRRGADAAGFDTPFGGSTFDADENWDFNTRWTTEEIARRKAEAKAKSRAKAEAASWWRFEKDQAARRQRLFREASAKTTARRGERHVSAFAHLWHTRAGIVWQDVLVAAVGVGCCAYAGYRLGVGARTAAREPPKRTSTSTADHGEDDSSAR